MSNQNFDTNSPFPSSAQPLPIAQQLGSQSYLSQVQDKRDALADDAKTKEPSDAKQPRSNPRPVQEKAEGHENKMDAFFRQAEQEREREKADANAEAEVEANVEVEAEINVEAENEAEESNQDHQSSDSSQTHQSPELQKPRTQTINPQQSETPVVEIPSITSSVADSVQDDVQPLSGNEATFQTVASVDTGSQKEMPFSLNSFKTSFENPASEQPLQTPSQQPQLRDPAQMELPASTNEQPAPSSESLPTLDPSYQNQNEVASPPQDTRQSDGESRKLTGAAALSAGMAAAGLGAFAGRLVNEKSAQPETQIEEQSNLDVTVTNDMNAMKDPSDLLRQQMADEEQEFQSRGSLATYDMSNNASTFESTEAEDSEVDNALPIHDQPNLELESHQNKQWQSPIESQANKTNFNDAKSSDVASAEKSFPASGSNDASADGLNPNRQPLLSENSDGGSGKFSFGNNSRKLEQSPVEIVEEIHYHTPDPELESVRLAAEQKAQQLKAEQAKAFAERVPVHARPYGAVEKKEGMPSSQEPQTQVALQSAFSQDQVSQRGSADVSSAVEDPQEPKSQLIKDIRNADGTTQRRPFPLNLFNRHLLRNLRSGVAFVDHQRRVQLWSKGAEGMTGIFSEAVNDRPLHPQTFNLRFDDGTPVTLDKCPIVQCLETMQNVTGNYRLLNSTNQEVKVVMTVCPVIDENRYVNGAIVIFDDQSAEIDLQRQLKDLYEFSVLDPLTQVANRAEFERVLEEYVRAFNQSDSFNCSIIICDLDFFKSINDKFGHTVGDQALVGFAEMLKKYVRSQDLVARYGGEEFVILCADCNTDSALQRAEKIRMALFKTSQPMLGGKSISASFGVSELRQGDTAMEFFVRADTALLQAKELGRNRVVIADQREASRGINVSGDESISGLQWRKQRREHTALVCEEYQTNTPVPVLIEKLRGFIIEKDAWLQRVDQEFLSMEVDFEDPKDYGRKGSFTLNIEFKEADEQRNSKARGLTYIRISIFPGRKKKWFSTNHTDVVTYLLNDLRSYLMINDEASHLTIDMATENVRD